MKIIILIISIIIVFNVNAQKTVIDFYVAAKSGLSIRKSPSLKSEIVKKILYGDKIKFLYFDYSNDSTSYVDGFPINWMMVRHGNDSGYVVDAFVFPFPPPTSKQISIDAYLRNISKPLIDSLKIGSDDPLLEEDIDVTYKTILKNGVEIIKRETYEYGSETYILPFFDSRKAFQLLRLIEISDFNLVLKTDMFPTKNKIIIRTKDCKVSVSANYKKNYPSNTPWNILLQSDCDCFIETEIIELENQAIITIRFGD